MPNTASTKNVPVLISFETTPAPFSQKNFIKYTYTTHIIALRCRRKGSCGRHGEKEPLISRVRSDKPIMIQMEHFQAIRGQFTPQLSTVPGVWRSSFNSIDLFPLLPWGFQLPSNPSPCLVQLVPMSGGDCGDNSLFTWPKPSRFECNILCPISQSYIIW